MNENIGIGGLKMESMPICECGHEYESHPGRFACIVSYGKPEPWACECGAYFPHLGGQTKGESA